MSIKKLLHTLKELGFKQTEARVYVYLAKKGSKNAKQIYTDLKLTKQQLYPCLKKLKNKNMICSSLEHPVVFSALPLDKVLDMFVDLKISEAEETEEHREEILLSWRDMQDEDI